MFKCVDLLFYWGSLVKDKGLSSDGWVMPSKVSPSALSLTIGDPGRGKRQWTQIQLPRDKMMTLPYLDLLLGWSFYLLVPVQSPTSSSSNTTTPLFPSIRVVRAVCPYSTWMFCLESGCCLGIKFERNCLVQGVRRQTVAPLLQLNINLNTWTFKWMNA